MRRPTPGFARVSLAIVFALAAAGAARAAAPALPKPVERRLENGLRVVVLPSHRLPVVSVELFVPAGQTAEPERLSGIAPVVAKLLTRGTTSRDPDQFALDVARLGASVSAGASRDYATLGGTFLARDLGAGLELLSDATINSIFSDDEVRSALIDALRGVDRERRDPTVIADEGIWNLLYPGHPYGRPAFGKDSSITAITRDKIRTFHRDHYRPDGAMLVIAGDVQPDSAFSLAGTWFGRWAGHATPIAQAAIPERPTSVRVRLVDAPDAPFSVVRIGLMLPGKLSDDQVALSLAAAEFAGGAFSRLQSARVISRIGSSEVSNLLELKDGGVLSFGALVNTDSVAADLGLLLHELADFSLHPPGASDLPAIRRGALGGYLGPLETLGGLIGQWAGSVFIGGPADGMDRTIASLSTMTEEQLAGVIRRWFDAGHAAIVVVGPAAKLEAPLARFGSVEVQRVPPPIAASAQAAAVDTIAATPENVAQAHAVLEKAFAAHGGLEAFQHIHDSVIDMKIAMGPMVRQTPGKLRQMRKDPNRMVSIAEFNDITTRQVLNGEAAWSVTGQTVVDADSLQLAGLKASYLSDLPHLMLTLRDPATRVIARGTDRITDRNVDALDVRTTTGQYRRYYFDAETHLLAAIDFFEGVPGLSQHRSRRLFGAYQTIDGLHWPFREERQIDGQSSMRIEITGIRTNTGVLDKEFEKPIH